MNYVVITEYPNLVFGKDFVKLLSGALSKRTKLGLLDSLYRLNRYGLDSMMTGSRLRENSEGVGILYIQQDTLELELMIEAKESSLFVRVHSCKRKGLEAIRG
ncbi:hypothetical protein CN425_02395 [Bacillus cereus]|uniref:Uncharacterized protein n=1 Tax=Bacillus cereus TaxID=1396 RepID=A0A2A9UQW1_BACCE|nr:hypothetical protein [Bacillus cereus]EJS65853.1 hypothetical protein ICU_03927 [Bacillus cereus BAG2X1-1]EJS73995.1 hypothetical protein ICY_03781 [Bacillus cereus BAG2X1-3]PEA07936.1 hypothetical protein CON38_19825 [Bacillus cereus]PEW06160.1 hypothetical protein CN425_02395 [Bacillus cereus]PEX91112.1 hypothetical protein CN450_10560 [Bacillus cereus]